MVMLSKVEHVMDGISKHILSELDKETSEMEQKSAHKAYNDYHRKK
ncbi:MAG: hypothetical protein U9Q69_02295 [Nanoarchaeota archaeon]|nr:hypothetical protein [Nanoarchaeota archaeon]